MLNSISSHSRNARSKKILSNIIDSWIQFGQDLTGSNIGDLFGHRVAINSAGNRFISSSSKLTNDNYVKVFSSNETLWSQIGTTINSNVSSFGSDVAINGSGNRIAISAPNYNTFRGIVYTYYLNGSSWSILASGITSTTSGDYFGSKIFYNQIGDRLAISSIANSSSRGYVKIYSFDGSSWTQLGQKISGTTNDENFASSVSTNSVGDKIIIGANGNSYSVSGKVKIYSLNGSIWSQMGLDISAETDYDLFGASVSINSLGDKIVIGAPYARSISDDYAGYATIYYWSNNTWNKIEKLQKNYSDAFGSSVSMNSNGSIIAIGGPGMDLQDPDDPRSISGTVSTYKTIPLI
jgi:hypothetical protein